MRAVVARVRAPVSRIAHVIPRVGTRIVRRVVTGDRAYAAAVGIQRRVGPRAVASR
jgi:hypothetical protein